MKIISKSNFALFKRCPKALWLSFNKKELAAPLRNTELKRIEYGKAVGELAKKYFKSTVDVTTYKNDGTLDFEAMLAKTQELIKQGDIVIAEATFEVNNLFCSVDLLRCSGKGCEIYEVKSVTNVDTDHKIDAAFQKYVVEQSGLTVINTYLLHLNKDYVRHGELELHKLFKTNLLDEDETFKEALLNIKSDLNDLNTVLLRKREPKVELLSRCRGCDFYAYCHKDIPFPSVFDINYLNGYEYLNNGIVTFEDLKVRDIKLPKKRQNVQLEAYLENKEVIIDKKGLKAFLKHIKYPVYHLDFETYQMAIPPCDNMSPYDQIPTQYSLHIEHEDGRLEHKEFLGDSLDPRRAIAEALCRDIPHDVCVTAYYKNFECGRLNELAELFPDLAPHLRDISNNIVDLLVPFKSGHYYHKDMGKSNSIKAVLPALYPNDPELDYIALPVVHNGSEAMIIYPLMLKAEPREKARIRAGLLAYCKLDTLAMVKLLQKLQAAI